MKEKKLELSNKKKKVMVFGGTGFIGCHITKELLENNYEVTCVSKDENVQENDYIKGASFTFADLEKIDEKETEELLSGYDYFIFAAGVDDRYIPKAPALEFFRKANVDTTLKITKAAKRVGVQKGIIITSYFAHFARQNPEWELTKHHPYIKSRVEQEDECMKLADDTFSVVVLQLPYVIGAIKGRKPLFKPLVKYLHLSGPTLFMNGGTAVVTVKQVARAVKGALSDNIVSNIYPIATQNLSWNEFIKKINPKKRQIIHIPKFLIKAFGWLIDTLHRLKGKEGGLKMTEYVNMQVSKLFLNLNNHKELFDIIEGELEDAFEEMVTESII